jgi:hypothetical protein
MEYQLRFSLMQRRVSMTQVLCFGFYASLALVCARTQSVIQGTGGASQFNIELVLGHIPQPSSEEPLLTLPTLPTHPLS